MKPILFSTPMVQAILDDRKTQTRRITGLEDINKHPDDYILEGFSSANPKRVFGALFRHKSGLMVFIPCPYGEVGGILWIREKFRLQEAFEFDGETTPEHYWYYATTPDIVKCSDNEEYPKDDWKWKPSIHMPKAACRIWLQIIDIRIERLQKITEEDAIAEGVYFYGTEDSETDDYKNYLYDDKGNCDDFGVKTAKESFQTLWQKINSEDSWNQNPWVWVIELKRVEKPC